MESIEDFSNISDSEMTECIPNGKKYIECFICGQRMTKISDLRQHISNHSNEDTYDLENMKNSEIYRVLNPHTRRIDPVIIRDFIINEIVGKRSRCSQFYVILNEGGNELDISDSETDDDQRKTYKCELCKKIFDRRYKIMFHQKTMHKANEMDIECDFCMKKFVCMNLLIRHLKIECENDEKPICCIDRFKMYLLKANLDQFAYLTNIKQQKKIRKLTAIPKIYSCNFCHKTFKRSEHLNRHKAVHLPEELKFECPQCDRRFNRKDNMRSHMKVHAEASERNAEERAILCSYCGHSFASKSNYIVHVRRHTGDKPYQCNVCGKRFPKSTDLNSHKITHTGEKNFVCIVCEKAFARSAVLLKHMRTHAGPYNCNVCEKQFIKPKDLNFHIRSHIVPQKSYTSSSSETKSQCCNEKSDGIENKNIHHLNSKNTNLESEQHLINSRQSLNCDPLAIESVALQSTPNSPQNHQQEEEI